MNKKFMFLLLVAVSVAVLSVGGWWLWQTKQVRTVGFTSDQTSFSYRADLAVQTLSKQDKQDKYIFRALQHQDEPPLLITLRYEEGIKAIASISKQEPIDLLADNTRLAHPQRFPGYKEVSRRNIEVNGHKAVEFIFTYQNKDEILKQQFWIIIKGDNTALYLAFQSKESDFDKLAGEYFNTIANTLSIK